MTMPELPAATPVREQELGGRLFRVAPRVYRISLPTEFAVGDVNAYLLDGPGPALIDTGVHSAASLEVLEGALARLGRRSEELAALLLTHPHVDHCGAVAGLRERSGAPVLAHPRGRDRLRDLNAAHAAAMPWFRRFFESSGLAGRFIERYEMFVEYFQGLTRPCDEVEGLAPGQTIELAGGRRVLVHETFGHTANHVSFELVGEGVLLTGDHLLPTITANPTLQAPEPGEAGPPRALVQYRESLERTARLDVRVACPGHGRPFVDVAGRCRAVLEHQRARVAEVAAIVRAGGPMTRDQISRALFGKRSTSDVYLALSEVHAAVELLAEDGVLEVEADAQGLAFVRCVGGEA